MHSLIIYFPKREKKAQATKLSKRISSSKNSTKDDINKEGIIFKPWPLTSN